MYSNGGQRNMNAKILIAANFLPPIIGADAAMVNRKAIIPFVTRYSSKAPADPNEQRLRNHYPANKYFNSEIPSIAAGLLYDAVSNYSSYIDTDMDNRPENVQQASNNYWYNTDVYMQFVHDCVRKVYVTEENDDGEEVVTDERDMEKSVTVEAVYDSYLKYLEVVKPSSMKPNMFTVRKEISNRIGQPYENRWWAVKIDKKKVRDATKKHDGDEKIAAQIEDFSIYEKDILGKARLMYDRD